MVYCVLVCWLRMTSSCICGVCHLYGVHDLYSVYRYYVYVYWLACEVYRSSRSRHKDSNRYFSFCQKNALILVCFLCFFSLSSRRDPFFLCLCERESVFLVRWFWKGFASGMTKGKQYRIPYSNWIPAFAGVTETQKPWIASFLAMTETILVFFWLPLHIVRSSSWYSCHWGGIR